MTEKVVIRTSLGQHDHVVPLRDGRVTSEKVAFDFVDYDPLPKAFRHMVRGGDLDLSEMAVVTHLMARHFGKPLTGLAIPLWSRPPHTNLVCAANSTVGGPKDLEGHKIGVRAYGQTSGVWVRGVLANQYGVDLNSIRWITMEDSHLTEYQDPSIAERNRTGKGLRDLMLSGDLAAIMGERIVSPDGVRTVVPDAEAAARAWSKKNDLTPINHGAVLRTELHVAHPWLGEELMALFTEARRIAIEDDGAAPPPEYGFAANRASLDLLLEFSMQQRITPRRYVPEDLFLQL